MCCRFDPCPLSACFKCIIFFLWNKGFLQSQKWKTHLASKWLNTHAWPSPSPPVLYSLKRQAFPPCQWLLTVDVTVLCVAFNINKSLPHKLWEACIITAIRATAMRKKQVVKATFPTEDRRCPLPYCGVSYVTVVGGTFTWVMYSRVTLHRFSLFTKVDWTQNMYYTIRAEKNHWLTEMLSFSILFFDYLRSRRPKV